MNRFTKLALVASLAVMSLAEVVLAFPACSWGHCTKYNTLTVQQCIDIHGEGNISDKSLELHERGVGRCVCPCSCVVGDTLVKLSNGSAEKLASELVKGEELYLPHGERNYAPAEMVLSSSVEKGELVEISFSNGSSLKTSSNHTFVRSNGKIAAAEALRAGDEVKDNHSNPVTVTSTKRVKDYSGKLYNFIVNPTSPAPVDHVLVTGNIQSGDWLLQTTQDQMKTEMDLRLGRVGTLDTYKK